MVFGEIGFRGDNKEGNKGGIKKPLGELATMKERYSVPLVLLLWCARIVLGAVACGGRRRLEGNASSTGGLV